MADNTLFIFTSDNGPEGRNAARGGSTGGLSGRKRDDLEGGIRVPGIVRWPGHIEPGTVSSVPVIGSDVFTTVLAAAGVPIPTDRTIDGASMVPAFSGQPVIAHSAAILADACFRSSQPSRGAGGGLEAGCQRCDGSVSAL